MFKRPYLPKFFKEPGKKQLKEEKLLIKVIREKSRPAMIDALSSENQGELPSDREVEEALDLLIDRFSRNGQLKQMLDEYLQEKIAEEKARVGL